MLRSGAHILLLGLAVTVPASAFDTLECHHEVSSALGWRAGGLTRSAGMEAETRGGGDEKISFILADDQGILKGNHGDTAVMVRINDYFLEPTIGGNMTVWRYFPAKGMIPPYMIQMITIRLGDLPTTAMSAWRCDPAVTNPGNPSKR